jgi:transposase
VSFLKFVLAIKLFELEVSSRQASKELGLSYNTTHKIFKIIRQRIYQHCSGDDVLKGEVEADESYFGGRRRKGKRGRGTEKIPVFGMLERGGKVKVEIFDGCECGDASEGDNKEGKKGFNNIHR